MTSSCRVKAQKASDLPEMWITTVVLCSTVSAFPTPDEERMMQPLSAAASGNYTISFMPLLTVLVNMFPRLLTRVRVQPLTQTTHARKLEALWEWERDSLCQLLETTPWASEEDPCHFYSCSYSKNSYCPSQERRTRSDYKSTMLVTSTQIDDCISLEVRRCLDATHRYNPQKSTCEPTDNQQQLMCQYNQ